MVLGHVSLNNAQYMCYRQYGIYNHCIEILAIT